MARSWFKVRNLTRQTTSSTTYTDVLSLTFSPDANKSYYLTWSALFDNSVTNSNANHRLRNDTASTTIANPVHRAPNAADIMSVGGFAKWTAGASPPSQTFSIEHAVDVGSATMGTADAYLMAIEAAASDGYAESTSNSSTTSNVLLDKVSLGFTPAAGGDYLVLCSCEIAGFIPASTDGVGRVLLDINGAQYFDTIDGYFAQTNSQFASWCHGIVVNLMAAPQTIKIRYASSDNTTTAQIRQARILAMRLDSFSSANTAQNNTRQTTTSSLPQVAAGTTFGAIAHDYMFIGTALVDHSTSVTTMEAKVDWGGVTRSSLKRRQVSSSGSRRASYVALGYDALPVGSQTINVDWWRTTSGTSAITDAFIGAFLLDIVNAEVAVPSVSAGTSGLAPAIAVGAAAIVPAAAEVVAAFAPLVSGSINLAAPVVVAGLAGLVPLLAVDVVIRAGPSLVAVAGWVPLAVIGTVVRVDLTPAAAVWAHDPVRAGPLWRAINENQAVWEDRAPAVSTWTPVSAA